MPGISCASAGLARTQPHNVLLAQGLGPRTRFQKKHDGCIKTVLTPPPAAMP